MDPIYVGAMILDGFPLLLILSVVLLVMLATCRSVTVRNQSIKHLTVSSDGVIHRLAPGSIQSLALTKKAKVRVTDGSVTHKFYHDMEITRSANELIYQWTGKELTITDLSPYDTPVAVTGR
jgi:hypothetical protein